IVSARRYRMIRLFLNQRGNETFSELRKRRCFNHARTLSIIRHRKLDERIVRDTPVDGERGNTHARDHREGEESRSDDVTESLETRDGFPDTLEPAIGPYRIEGKDAHLHRSHNSEDLARPIDQGAPGDTCINGRPQAPREPRGPAL